ncbi:MAG: hypothetical protein BZ138_06895 [Methanosphaera sp. rholeuAM270]|nr:MAG: hypothetical protein BZ138_06895 [Methanosphaera sp. rholeuAM270]
MTCDTCNSSSCPDEHIEDGRYGLHDGTPGCWGVLVDGIDDPRFDIESDKFEPFGFIYLLTNKINEKKYVGQTSKTVEERWKRHVSEAHSYIINPDGKAYTAAMDQAIAKYGEENFTVSELECCLIRVLDNREIYWIQQYDCCVLDNKGNGYNVSRGGAGYRKHILDEKRIVEDYLKGTSLVCLGEDHGVLADSIKSVLLKNRVPLRDKEELIEQQRLQYGQTVKQLDDDGNVLREFNSQAHAADWIVEQGLSTASSKSVRVNIKNSFFTGHRAYGFHWKIEGFNDEEYERQQEKYWKARQKCNILAQEKAKKAKTNICAYKGCNVSILPELTYCREHARKINGQSQPSRCPKDIDEVIKLVCEKSFEAAGRNYGVNGNSVRKWFKTRGIPFHTKELLQYAIDKGIVESL